jgi:hypothetical protein
MSRPKGQTNPTGHRAGRPKAETEPLRLRVPLGTVAAIKAAAKAANLKPAAVVAAHFPAANDAD